MIPVRTIFRNLTTVWVLALLWGSIASAGPLDDAIRLYDAGRYNEARPLLERGAGALRGAGCGAPRACR